MTAADEPRPEEEDGPPADDHGAPDDPRPQVEGDVEGSGGAGVPSRRPDVDVEAAWADIVARWGDAPDAAAEVRRPARPSGRDGGAPGRRVVREPGAPAGPGGTTGPAEPRPPGPQDGPLGPAPAPGVRDGAPRRPPGADDDVVGWEDRPAGPTPDERPPVVPEDEGHYEPPPLPPAPPADRVTRLAWVGALAGPALLLLCALVWRDAPALVVLAAVAAFVAGFGVLVSRLPRSRDDDDDGAVV